MNTISSQIQHTQERHKDYKNLFSTVNICSQENGRNKNDSCVEKISACGHAGGNFLHQYQYGTIRTSAMAADTRFDSTSIQVFQAVTMQSGSAGTKRENCSGTGNWMEVETMPYRLKI